MKGTHVLNVIRTQGKAWQALAEPHKLSGQGQMVFAGSGSSYYLAQVAAYVALLLGLEAKAVPSAEIVSEADVCLKGRGRLILISRSGTTTEALLAAHQASRRDGWHIIAVTCHPDSPLAEAAHQVLASPLGEDDTVVMVRSFTSMLLLLQAALTEELPKQLANQVDPLLASSEPLVKTIAHDPPRRLYVLGAQVRHGIAQEAALKAQEMSNQPAWAYHPLEFRHGPWGSVTPKDVVVLLGQPRYVDLERALVRDLKERTPGVAVIAQKSWFDGDPGEWDMTLPEDYPDWYLGPLALVPLQYLAWQWTIAVGQDPDHPANLTEVVRLNPSSQGKP